MPLIATDHVAMFRATPFSILYYIASKMAFRWNKMRTTITTSTMLATLDLPRPSSSLLHPLSPPPPPASFPPPSSFLQTPDSLPIMVILVQPKKTKRNNTTNNIIQRDLETCDESLFCFHFRFHFRFQFRTKMKSHFGSHAFYMSFGKCHRNQIALAGPARD